MVRGAVAVAAALILGSCSESNPPPAAPSPPTVTITPAPAPKLSGVSIIGAPANLRIGTSTQLRAISRAEDGSFQDVTEQATWQSSDPTVCSVDGTGALEGKGAGTATITTRYSGVSGTTTVTCGFVISLFVHENAPTAAVVLPGARVEVVGGPLNNRTFFADEQGRLSLPPVPGAGFALHVKKSGFDDLRVEIYELPRQTSLSVGLMPAPVAALRVSGTCTGFVAFSTTHRFTTIRESRVRASAVPGTTFEFLCSTLQREQGGIPTTMFLNPCGSGTTEQEAIIPPGNYSFYYYLSAGCPRGEAWGLVLEHVR